MLLTDYVKVKDIVATGIDKRTIHRRIQKGKYQYRIVRGNGGKQYEILVSSLEDELKEKLLTHTHILPVGAENSGNNTVIAPHFFKRGFLDKNDKELLQKFNLDNSECARIIPQKAKEKALLKVDLIKTWQEYRHFSTMKKSETDKNFVKLFNDNILSEKLHADLGDISAKSLYRWAKEYEKAGNNYEVLADCYTYGTDHALKTTLSDIEKVLLLKYMLHQNKFKLADAYELIVLQLQTLNVTHISSEGAYRRVWSYVCKNYADVVSYAREGLKAALDTRLPYLTRNKEVLNVGDVLVADGHVLDFMVKNPVDGKAYRATLIGFLDWASGDLCGYELMFTENTQSVGSALRNSIIRLGKIPKTVYLDNGRAFKNKTFGGKRLSECGIRGVYEKLGIQTAFSKPYNGRSKVIERFWEEFTNSFAKMMPSYIGNNIQNQPAATKRNEKFHKKLRGDAVPTIADVKNALEVWLNCVYRIRKQENGLTISENFNLGKGPGVDTNKLDDLMLASTPREIGRNGVKMFNEYYYAPELTGLKNKVIARYSMFDLTQIKIYSLQNEYICTARRVESVHPLAGQLGSPKDLAEYKQKQKEIRKIQKQSINKSKNILGLLYPVNAGKTVKAQKTVVFPAETTEQKYQITCYS